VFSSVPQLCSLLLCLLHTDMDIAPNYNLLLMFSSLLALQEGFGTKLGDLRVYSVPTFHFYHQGEKTTEVVGADTKKLEAAMESLHKAQ